VHDVAFVEFQLNVDAPPLATDAGFAVSEAVGTTLIPALTAALVPPAPLQVSMNVELLISGPVL